MKKCFLSMLTIALCAAMLACPAALAEDVTAETGQVKAAIVTEAQSGQRIFEKNAEERLRRRQALAGRRLSLRRGRQ
ncbi:MAG: hypothetical protein KH409_08260 [Clostridium sp.]|nr:hypothetical protein [Clostridium sp.]